MMKDKFLGFLGLSKRAGKLLQGYNKCEDALKYKTVFLIILSEDLAQNTVDKFTNYSEKYNVPLIRGYKKEQLGEAIGLEEINVLGINDENMSKKLMELWKNK